MLEYLKKEKLHNCILVVLIILGSGTKIGTSLTLTITLNSLISKQMEAFIFWTMVNITFWALWILQQYVLTVQKKKVICKMSAAIRNDVADRLSQASYETFHKEDTGAYVSWLCNDVKLIEDSAFESFYMILDAVFTAFFSVVSLWSYHPALVGVTLAASIFIMVVPNLKSISTYLQESVKKYSFENELFIAKITDTLQGFDEFFSYNLQERMLNSIDQSSVQFNRAAVQNTRKQSRVNTLVLIINVAGQLIVNLSAGILIIFGYISAGTILSVGQFAGNIFNSLGNISSYVVAINSTIPVFNKLKNIEMMKDSNISVERVDNIQLEHVNYNYGNGAVFHHDIQMSFQEGGKYAIVGESGSGKSTLMNILSGKLLGYEGSIRVGGEELKKLSSTFLREQIILINQKPYLFNTTVRDNILMGRNIDEGRLNEILEASDLTSVISNLPNGLDTSITGNGSNLSGGQRQRITLARAMAFGRKILILDEGTSALNQESAFKIESTLLENPELTIIMITHHLQKEIEERLTAVYKI